MNAPLQAVMPQWWLWVMAASSAVLLCSCQQAFVPEQLVPLQYRGYDPNNIPATVPEEIIRGQSPHDSAANQPMPPQSPVQQVNHQVPCPAPMAGPHCQHCPPGPMAMPKAYPTLPVTADMVPYKPTDEYICDGGDRGFPVTVGPDWTLYDLDLEDTVIHYDTLEGETYLKASNKVCIYAPRFAAVRSVAGLNVDEQQIAPRGATAEVPFVQLEEALPPIARTQNLQPVRAIGNRKLQGLLSRQFAGAFSQTAAPFDYTSDLLPFENMSIVRYGVMEQGEKPMLAQAALAAVTWTHDLAVAVAIDGERASEVVIDQKAQETKTFEVGEAKIRILKIADDDNALPGEFVNFTLRFDNVGSRTIGNVVIVDNLTTRLEYVEDSMQASVKNGYERNDDGEIKRDEEGNPIWKQNPVRFSTKVNDGDSLTLRWELEEPLEPGQGGIIRFKTRVR